MTRILQYFKAVHRNHLVEYYPNDETLPPMIEECVPMDRGQDDFFERFMEHRIQKLNNFEQPSMEDSLLFPIETLRTAPVTLPQKRVSNTSSDSGVNSPHVLSPAIPTTPDNSQPYLTSSTSRKNLPSVPLTPIQQFINNSRKPKKKEPKYNCSQPHHPDPHSVLRTSLYCHCAPWVYFRKSLKLSEISGSTITESSVPSAPGSAVPNFPNPLCHLESRNP